ncbi:starch-binding domain-containing protein 1, partial [Echinops telfairi]|uniref:Starch-binding domain-containing protein 1 n=1 Tax=Echinops telfairi TaxID=9371 RepID=A0ABM0IMG3_ECHTE
LTRFWLFFCLSEHLQGNNGCLVSETTGLGNLWHPQEAAWPLHGPPGADGACDTSRVQASSGQSPNTASLAASGDSSACSEAPRNKGRDHPVRGGGFQKGQETPSKEAPCLTESAPSSNLHRDRPKGVHHPPSDSSDLADQQEDWEMVSRHSSWGDAGLSNSLEALVLSASQGMDCGQSALGGAKGQGVEVKTVALFPEAQQVSVRFQVHYVTSPGEQLIAVTGDHERLGGWSTYIPLQGSKDGFWSRPIALPADTVVQWKFVVVEKGEVTRWEECSNRLLETGHEDKVVQEWWGLHGS